MSKVRGAAQVPPPIEDGQSGPAASTVERDAARWRAIASSERITAMGWSGFYTGTGGPKANSRDLHVTLNFWNKHPPDGGGQAAHGRAMFMAYVDAIVAEQEGAPEALPEGAKATDTIPSSEQRNAVLEEALKPFAELSECRELSPAFADDNFPLHIGLMNGNVTQGVIRGALTVGDVRRAAAALKVAEGSDGKAGPSPADRNIGT